MSQLIVIAKITAKSDQVDRVKSALLKLIEPTRQE
ncbi:MAG: quinol monooxygenase YgiN, partial [Thalassolituus sp.]